jgi:hypothetical protein
MLVNKTEELYTSQQIGIIYLMKKLLNIFIILLMMKKISSIPLPNLMKRLPIWDIHLINYFNANLLNVNFLKTKQDSNVKMNLVII